MSFNVSLLKTFTGCVVNLILSYMKKTRMFIYITKVFIKKCQVNVYTKEGIFYFILQMRLSDLISVLLGEITLKHCMSFKCKYKREL